MTDLRFRMQLDHALGDGQSYYYLVTAVNACGDESTD